MRRLTELPVGTEIEVARFGDETNLVHAVVVEPDDWMYPRNLSHEYIPALADDDDHAKLYSAASVFIREETLDALRWALGFIEYQGKPSPLDDPREGTADSESYKRALEILDVAVPRGDG